MFLKEQKTKILSLIEELNTESKLLTNDPDISLKINSVINQIQMELARIKKIPTKIDIEIPNNKILSMVDIEDYYQLFKIPNTKYEVCLTDIIFDSKEVGIKTIYYYKYPKLIPEVIELLDEETDEEANKRIDDEYEFELPPEVLEIMPYGVAADLLKNDMISGYGKYYYDRYNELKQMIDSRLTAGVFVAEGGLDI